MIPAVAGTGHEGEGLGGGVRVYVYTRVRARGRHPKSFKINERKLNMKTIEIIGMVFVALSVIGIIIMIAGFRNAKELKEEENDDEDE